MKSSKRFQYVNDRLSELGGGAKVGFDNATYLSEKDTADKNFALSYYMKESKVFPDVTNLKETTDLYFQVCSILVTCDKLAIMAATLANGGKCPLTGKRLLKPETVKCTLQLMLSCGMYDFSGEWACTVGLPAKSGVAGAVFVVIPGVMGICVFSPRLDKRGNSVRAVDFYMEANKKFTWNIFDRLVCGRDEDDEEDVKPSVLQISAALINKPPDNEERAINNGSVNENEFDHGFTNPSAQPLPIHLSTPSMGLMEQCSEVDDGHKSSEPIDQQAYFPLSPSPLPLPSPSSSIYRGWSESGNQHLKRKREDLPPTNIPFQTRLNFKKGRM